MIRVIRKAYKINSCRNTRVYFMCKIWSKKNDDCIARKIYITFSEKDIGGNEIK